MKRFQSLLLISMLMLSCSLRTEAALTINILSSNLAGAIADGDGDDDLNAFYQGEGFTSSIFTGAVTATELSGVNLFVAMLPDDAFSTLEITEMSNFLGTGGRILFIGEQAGFAATQNVFLNSALNDLGSTMSLGTTSIGSGFSDTSVGQIRPHPFNTNVTILNYGNVNSISGIPVGGELFLEKDLITPWAGVENVGGGTVILLADVNMISHIEDTAGNDNHQFFINIVPIPEPSSALLLGISGLFLMFRRSRS